MPLVVRNVYLGLDEPDEALLPKVARRLGVPVSAIRAYAVARRSLDARNRQDIRFVYQVELDLNESVAAQRARLRRCRPGVAAWLEPREERLPEPGSRTLPQRPIVIGFGPAGMFAALRLAQFGYRPLVLERGRDVKRRHRDVMQRFYRRRDFDPESNLLFGEGGAGAYSDGKLYTRVNDPLCRRVLETLYQHGADPDILVDARPHIGSDRLPRICTSIRQGIESLGGEIRFEWRLDDIRIENSRLTSIRLSDGDTTLADRWIPVGPVLLAIGHSARDTIRMLHRCGVRIDAKPFQIGVRIEHPQTMVDGWQYGAAAGHRRLAPAEYHLVAGKAAGPQDDLFSFCMCPGGMILPTNESPGLIATNGASRARRSGPFANSGLVIGVKIADLGIDPSGNAALQALAYLEQWERLAYQATPEPYRLPVQRVCDFLTSNESDGLIETSYPLGAAWADLSPLLPTVLAKALRVALPALDKQFPGFAGPDGLVAAPESRASSPVRIARDPDTRQAIGLGNLYPVGEGAGYAGGIVSAAVDGIRSADQIIRVYAPPC